VKAVILAVVLTVVSGCSTIQGQLVWRVRELVLAPTSEVRLQGRNEEVVTTLKTQTVQKLMLAHIRISRVAGTSAELVIVEGDDPNAFATVMNGRRVIALNTAMVKFIGDDIAEYAALLGHEAAHWAKGHVARGQTRTHTIRGLGNLVGAGLGMAGVPAAGLISGLGADLIEASYSRSDEREADAASVDYMMATDFDPQAAVRFHEKLLQRPGNLRPPFLSSHPSGEERIENLRALIKAKQSQVKTD
jgi:predicted Zn-dependent protease